MTGLSYGYRTPSNGSLQQLGQNGGVLQSQNSFSTRKPSKGMVSSAREKEKFIPRICRYLGKNHVGMLILLVLALMAFASSFFTVSRDASRSWEFEAGLFNQTYHIPPILPNTEMPYYEVCSDMKRLSPPSVSNTLISLSSTDAFNHPCKNFAIPPPPPGDSRRIGPRPCPVCYVPVERAIASMPRLPLPSPVLHQLTYFSGKHLTKSEPDGGSDFGGYPSLKHRNESFDIKESMTVHCGFIKGCRPGNRTGFDIDEADLTELEKFHEIIVASAIFGNYDLIQQPKNISDYSRRNVPFFMFVDEETEAYMRNSTLYDGERTVGLWRIIVVHNIPYTDARRNGKVPKLLLHRLFPNVRYSIWIDGKLQLVVDPYPILERFLWRQNATFAISRHYRRFDVFVEAEANKAARKYDNASIDNQIEFYRKEGLTRYTRAKLPITSDVPEGCVIVREHTPITNLFSCLWFNEVDRFTARDQLSFSTVRDKIMAKVSWSINMFLDCERRNFVVQAYHRDLLEQRARLARARIRPPPAPIVRQNKVPVKKPRKRGKKSSSKRNRKVDVAGAGEILVF
ncbi:hypothetical protein Leryth_015913 [Lithospermum erythrorhizon]|nr:hypothetical protein Leryth_015913 [Lithospermum erythrorhizon]